VEATMWFDLSAAHARFCQGDPEAFAEIAACLLGSLNLKLRRQFGHLDEHLLAESVEDALLTYCAQPERFDASRGVSLDYFLEGVARGHLANHLRKARRRRQRERTGLSKRFWEEADFLRRLGVRDDNSKGREVGAEGEVLNQAFSGLLAELTPLEIAEVDLLQRGVRATTTWARLLGVHHLQREEQTRRVGNEKIRLVRKLQRLARRYPQCSLLSPAD
jgi:DNA-directed RNA polymerase specialized sigma24 family protein